VGLKSTLSKWVRVCGAESGAGDAALFLQSLLSILFSSFLMT